MSDICQQVFSLSVVSVIVVTVVLVVAIMIVIMIVIMNKLMRLKDDTYRIVVTEYNIIIRMGKMEINK